jgi:Tol biopolymer transport system component
VIVKGVGMMRRRTARALLLVVLFVILTGCGGKVEPPYVGAFYLEVGELVEIPQTSQYPFSVGAADPTLDDLVVIYVKYPLPSLEDLVLQRVPGNDKIPTTIDIKDDMVYELKPRSELADGDYCLVVADGTKSVENLTRWCFRIGDRATAVATEVVSTAAVPTEVAAPKPQNAPHWRLLAYDLSQAPSDPGWTDYMARLAYEALVPVTQGRLEVGGGYVLTAEGNQYPAIITRVDANEPGPRQFNPRLGITTLIDHEMTVYEPGIPVGHVPGVAVHGRPGYRRTDMFWLSFRVPESLVPISVHFPGFEPIDLDTLPAKPPIISEDYSPNYVPGDPIQITEAVTLRLGSPRKYQREYDGEQVLAFDVELTNRDVTADRQAAFIVSMVDNSGVLYYSPSLNCSESDLHYSDIGSGSFSTVLGPGQTQKGVFCVLGWDLARSEGPFVVIVTGGERYRDPSSSIYTFMVEVDGKASESTAPAAQPSTSVAACSGQGLILDMAVKGKSFQIYTMCPDGTQLLQLTNAGNNVEPFWSRDGSMIYFISDRDGNREIYVMNADGSSQRNLSNSAGSEYSVTLAPGGSHLSFSSDQAGNSDIWIMKSDGIGQRNLTVEYLSDDTGPVWSPDGTRLAFSSLRDGNNEIYIMDADGRNQTRLTNRSLNDYLGVWSLDGKSICFNSLDDDSKDWRQWSMTPEGEDLQEIGPVSGVCRPVPAQGRVPGSAMSPDGWLQVYAQHVGDVYQLFLAGTDGTGEIRITNDDLSWQVPSWQPRP